MSKNSELPSSGTGKYGKQTGSSKGPHGAEAWGEIDPALAHSAIGAVLLAGDAVLVGTTRDGGAVAMQLYSGDAIDKLYAATPQELSETLQGVWDAAKV